MSSGVHHQLAGAEDAHLAAFGIVVGHSVGGLVVGQRGQVGHVAGEDAHDEASAFDAQGARAGRHDGQAVGARLQRLGAGLHLQREACRVGQEQHVFVKVVALQGIARLHARDDHDEVRAARDPRGAAVARHGAGCLVMVAGVGGELGRQEGHGGSSVSFGVSDGLRGLAQQGLVGRSGWRCSAM